LRTDRRLRVPHLIVAIALAANAAIGWTVPAHAAIPPNNCVGIASDSNGEGHVTMQLPPAADGTDGDIGIIFVRPLAVVLRTQLDALGLQDLTIADHSMTAAGLTASERTNYLKSSQYGGLIADRCRFIIVGPFIPDVAAGLATPEQYVDQLLPLVGGLIDKNPTARIFVLNHYQTAAAAFTLSNNGFGLTPDRIASFQARFTQICQPAGFLGRIPQVTCLDTQPLFDGMGLSYLLGETDQAHFLALVYRPTGFRPTVEGFFKDHPDGSVIGDGIHLSLAGRIRLMQRMAAIISDSDAF